MTEEILTEIKEIRISIQILTEKLDKHVSFVDTLYSYVRSPLIWVVSNINNFMGINEK